jgi:hypothetical protein
VAPQSCKTSANIWLFIATQAAESQFDDKALAVKAAQILAVLKKLNISSSSRGSNKPVSTKVVVNTQK